MLLQSVQMHALVMGLVLFMTSAPVAVTGKETIAPNALVHSAMLMLIHQKEILIVQQGHYLDLNTLF